MKDIKRFEDLNNVLINVYGLDEKNKVFPLQISEKETYKERFDLLFLQNESDSHYFYINNLSRLVSNQMSSDKSAKEICHRCLTYFSRNYKTINGKNAEERLKEHLLFCNSHKAVRAEFPRDDKIKFKKFQRTQRIKIVAYADFKCYLETIEGPCQNPSISWSKSVQKHKIFCASLMVVKYCRCL